MESTTNINDLPSDPSVGENNVVLKTSEKKVSFENKSDLENVNSSIDNQKMMNEVVTGIQQASLSGSTSLPSRDIPMNTGFIASDDQIKPNYIPQEEKKEDYIKNFETEKDYINNNFVYNNRKDSLEFLYEELQIPIIIGLLFFIMQLPVVKNNFMKVLPSLFLKDGNPSFVGYVVNSIFFAMIFYIFYKFLNN